MKLQQLDIQLKYRSILRYALVVLLLTGFAFSAPVQAATITGFVETPTSLSFNFSGNGFSDFLTSSLPPLANWSIVAETHSQIPSTGQYGFALASLKHLPDGSVLLTLGDVSNSTPYGAAISDTKTIVHGSGLDTYFVTITVNASSAGNGQWGTYSGSFSAVHNAPEGGSTLLMIMIGVTLIACALKVQQTNRV
jgi:hypothetical protein